MIKFVVFFEVNLRRFTLISASWEEAVKIFLNVMYNKIS